jgi:hypothetical protein
MLMFFLAVFVWSGLSISAVDILDHSRPLHASSTDHLDVPGFGFQGQSACDSMGNIYIRPTVALDDTAIVKLSGDGDTQTIYRLLSTNPSDSSNVFFAFSVTPHGDVWELVQAPDGSRIEAFQFGKEQEAEHRTVLDVPVGVHPQNFAVFENGEILFTGYYDRRSGTQLEGKTFSALFGSNGEVIKVIEDTSHEYVHDITRQPEGMVVRGDDNRVYFLQPTRVLIYSVSGDLLKEIRFEKPDKESRTSRLDVSDGLLSIEFMKPFQKQTPHGLLRGLTTSYLILNAADSRIVGYYIPDDEVGNNCLCFNRKEGYTFFRIENGLIKFVHAALK